MRGGGRSARRVVRGARAAAARRPRATLVVARAVRQIVGSVLVRNEDVFVERAIRNVAKFCDRIHAVDHASNDGTWPTLQSLARELDKLDVRRSRNSGE